MLELINFLLSLISADIGCVLDLCDVVVNVLDLFFELEKRVFEGGLLVGLELLHILLHFKNKWERIGGEEICVIYS